MNKQERMDKSIWETYRSIGDVLVEAGLMGAPKPGIVRRNSLRAIDTKLARAKGHKARKGTSDARDDAGRKKKAAETATMANANLTAQEKLNDPGN